MTIVFEDDLVLEEHKTFKESIKVHGNIYCKDGRNFNLTVKGSIDAESIDASDINAASIDASDIDGASIDAWNIDAENIDAADIHAGNIDALDIGAENIDAENIDAWNIDAGNIDADNISFYAFCISRKSLKCRSIEGRRNNSLYECLDSEIEFKEEPETCECCGQKIEDKEAEEQ